MRPKMSVNNRVNSHNVHECEGYHCHNRAGETLFCHQCDSHFCNLCWSRQASHLPGKVAVDGLPHEKIDIRIATRLEQIMNSSNSPRNRMLFIKMTRTRSGLVSMETMLMPQPFRIIKDIPRLCWSICPHETEVGIRISYLLWDRQVWLGNLRYLTCYVLILGIRRR